MNSDAFSKRIKKDFPIFKKLINHKKLIYLDNAATTQKPLQVINRIKKFYEEENSNTHSGIYTLSQNATKNYDNSRFSVAKYINADKEEIIFTKNTTESINLLAYALDSILIDKLKEGKNEIVLTEIEHHSNLVPWQKLAEKFKMNIKFIKVNLNTFELDYDDAKNKISSKTALISIAHVSNILGTINDVKKLVKLANSVKAISIIDGAQSIQHLKIDVKKINCDFFVFSSHKIFGPDGVGILYGKKDILKKLNPFNFGGGMIKFVSFKDVSFEDSPEKFEAGTQNISGVLGLAEAINYINKIGIKNIQNSEKILVNYAFKKLKSVKGLEIYSSKKNNAGIISFNLKGIHPHDVSFLLNEENICLRAGYHCSMPLANRLNENGILRLSLSFYNTFEDIDLLTNNLIKIRDKFENDFNK